MLLLFQLKISPFVSLKHGTMNLPCTMDNPCLARVDISAEVNNKEHVMAVDLSNTGEANFLSTPDQPCQSQNKTEFIKDKHSLITTDIDTKFELSVNESDNLTHDYYEYEQGQANIIDKDKLKDYYSFWKSIGCYDYILDTILNGYKIPLLQYSTVSLFTKQSIGNYPWQICYRSYSLSFDKGFNWRM